MIKKFLNLINRKKLLLLLVFFLTTISAYSQCTGCNVTNPSTGTFLANTTYCFTEDKTFSDVTFANNVKICIAEGKKLTIQNNINYTGSNPNVIFEISGTLLFGQSPQINANLTINIQRTGILQAGSSGANGFTFNGTGQNTLTNYGKVDVGVLGFGQGASTNLIDNYGILNIGGNINIGGATTFRNSGTINIQSSYNNNSNSVYINCGTINSNTGFNLGGGRVINTGIFNVGTGSVDMSTNSRMENYGNMLFKGSVNGSGNAVLYNEGLLRLTTLQMNGGSIKGPTSSSKKGYVYLINTTNSNGMKVGPNLDFTRYNSYDPNVKNSNQGQSQIFNGNPVFIDSNGNTVANAAAANVTYACTTCPALVTNIGVCSNTDGSFPPVAVNDTYTISPSSGSGTSVLSNDLVSYSGANATMSTVSITQISTTNLGVNINTNTGLVTISAGTPSGTYTIVYKICSTTNSSSCSNEATTVVTVIGTTTSPDPPSLVCTQPAVGGTPDGYTKIGISTQANPTTGWPNNVPNGHIVLESKNKGFVITRTVESAITNPVEGMLIYDTADRCIKLYSVDELNIGQWTCIQKSCNQ